MTDSRLADLEQRVVADAIDWFVIHYRYVFPGMASAIEDALARACAALIDARKIVPPGQLPLLRETPDDLIR